MPCLCCALSRCFFLLTATATLAEQCMSINGESRATCEKAACSLYYSYCHCSVENACVFLKVLCHAWAIRGMAWGGGRRGRWGLKHPLGSGVVLVKCPNSRFFPSWLCGGPHEMPNFEMCTLPVAYSWLRPWL